MLRAVSKVQKQGKTPMSPAKPALRRSNAFLHEKTPPKTPMKAASSKMSTGAASSPLTPIKSKKVIESSPASQSGGVKFPKGKATAAVNKAKNFANSTTGAAKGPKVVKGSVKKKPAKLSMKAFKRPAAASSTPGCRAKIVKATSDHFDMDISEVRMDWVDMKDYNESFGVAGPISWTRRLGRSNKLDKERTSVFPLALISFELW